MIQSWIAVTVAILVWGVTFASTRVLLEDFSSLEIQVARFALAWGTLWVIEAVARIRRAGSGRGAGWRDEALFAAMGLTGVFVYQFLENCAIYYTNASNVAIFVSFGPIVTAVMARMFARDRSLSPLLVAGSLVAVVGVALVSMNGIVHFHLRPLGDVMALGAMASWGVYSVLLDKANARGIPAAEAVRKSFFWALVLMVPLAVWGATEAGYYALDGSFSVTLDAAANAERFSRAANWGNLAFLGVMASAICFALWSAACRRLGMVRTTVGLYLTPVVGVAFAVAFLGERLTRTSVLGGAIILAGVAIASIRRTR